MRALYLSLKMMDFFIFALYFSLFSYFLFMVVFPILSCDWSYTKNLWNNWQTINAGMIALLSSIIAFSINSRNEKEKQKRNFKSACAYLPSTLSELTSYFRITAKELHQLVCDDKLHDLNKINNVVRLRNPETSRDHLDTLANCIKYGEDHTSNFISKLIENIQIHQARMRYLKDSLECEQKENTRELVFKENIIEYMYNLATIQIKLNRIFLFVRGKEPLNTGDLTIDEFSNMFSVFDWYDEDYFKNLLSLTNVRLGIKDF